MKITVKSDIDVEFIQQMGSDEIIGHAAWVSTRGSVDIWNDGGDSEKLPWLIRYLMKYRHGTPFEHGGLTVRVNAPIFVWREWHRHRIGFSYNEESARYKKLDPVFYIPEPTRPMFKVDGWKPGRPKFLLASETDDPETASESYEILCRNLSDSYETAYGNYESNLAEGIDPGLARDCLPVGIFSSCWVTANPRSIMAFLSLRVHNPDAAFVSYPLYEIDMAARKLQDIFQTYWPITFSAFVENGYVAP